MERPLVNSHHLWSPRRECLKTSLYTRLRTHRGFIIPMLVADHNQLHASIDHPELPSPDLAIDILQQAGPPDALPVPRASVLRETINMLYRESDYGWSREGGKQAERIANNLVHQLGFISLSNGQEGV